METTVSIAERVRQLSLELAMEMGDELDENEFGSPFEALEARATQIGDMLMREIVVQRHRLVNLEPPPTDAKCPDCQQSCQCSGLRRARGVSSAGSRARGLTPISAGSQRGV